MEADWRCQRERYWLTEYTDPQQPLRRGIVPVKDAFDLQFGSAFADGIATLTTSSLPVKEVINVVAASILTNYGQESYNLLVGLLYGATIHVLPRIMREYDVLGVESEQYYTWKGRHMFMSRPDLVLRRRADNTVWVPDWKTTKWKDPEWLLQWQYAIQLHLQAAAVQQTNPSWDVQGSIVFGAYKGYLDEYRHERKSPYTYIFHNTPGLQGLAKTYTPKYVAGWPRISASMYPDGGLYKWVERMALDYPAVLAEQYPTSQPIMLNTAMVEQVADERMYRNALIHTWRDHRESIPMAQAFPHTTSACKRCNYKEACWAPGITQDPLASGLYVPRTPNHELERRALDEAINHTPKGI